MSERVGSSLGTPRSARFLLLLPLLLLAFARPACVLFGAVQREGEGRARADEGGRWPRLRCEPFMCRLLFGGGSCIHSSRLQRWGLFRFPRERLGFRGAILKIKSFGFFFKVVASRWVGVAGPSCSFIIVVLSLAYISGEHFVRVQFIITSRLSSYHRAPRKIK